MAVDQTLSLYYRFQSDRAMMNESTVRNGKNNTMELKQQPSPFM